MSGTPNMFTSIMSLVFDPTLTCLRSRTYKNYIDVNNTTHLNSHNLRILSWNVNGDLKAKMLCPEFLNIITLYNICFFQEAHLYPLEHDLLNLPETFDVISLPRKYKKVFTKQFGGIVVLFKHHFKVSFNKELSSCDVMVLSVNRLILVNAYILPEYQAWDAFTDVDPFQKLLETLVALQECTQPVLLMGDLNARTRCRGSNGHPHNSEDTSFSTQGQALLDSCSGLNLVLLNGIHKFGAESQMFTSFQPRGQVVVDYAIANKSGLELTVDLEVLTLALEWSDHAAISLQHLFPGPGQGSFKLSTTRTHRKKLSRPSSLNIDTSNPLNALQKSIMNEDSSPDAKLLCLYGHPSPSHKVIEVYTDGSCHGNGTIDARAGSGVFWGVNAQNNLASRVPDKQTNNRGEIYAILKALHLAPKNLSLRIFTDSVYTIKSLAEWAPNSSDKAWKIDNGGT